MKYIKFEIEEYKGISKSLLIDFTKTDNQPTIPIIGTNESGKSSILHACLTFAYKNDSLDAVIKHLTITV